MSAKLLELKVDNQSVRGFCANAVNEALRNCKDPAAVLVIALARDGTYALRSVSDRTMGDFDIYSRAGALLERERQGLIR